MSDYETMPVGTKKELKRLRKLVVTGLEVVEDFMPNIGKCALQDYGRLNTFTIEADQVRREQSDDS